MPTPSFWKRVNQWVAFNPARWPHREAISRTVALVIVIAFLVLRFFQFDRFPQSFDDAQRFYTSFVTAAGQPVYSQFQVAALWGIRLAVWIVETVIYLGYVAAYISRAKAINVARGFMETAFPVIIAGLPIVLAFMPYSLPGWAPFSSPSHIYHYISIMALIIIGGLVNLIGLLTLRRAFTIMTEARELVLEGIFRHIRHPLYTGHFIMFLGSLLLRLHPVSILLYLLFCFGQVLRARNEERKLMQTFTEYAEYRKRTGMFFPKLLEKENK